ncbi:MAG: AbrB/MazE/SpoVT family DNA-binding domain-containing protein [Terracidiphilus sp.]|jgi:antitoxin VapB
MMATAHSTANPQAPAKSAKLFKNGRSQAVRLPKEFRFEGTEVVIRRNPENGEVVLLPAKRGRFHAGQSNSGAAPKLTLEQLYRIFDQADFPADFFERATQMPRELDLF